MSKITSENIRNVALVGHNGTGKTTLTEAILFDAGALRKKGSVATQDTVSDFDPEEKERGHSLETGITHFDYHGKRVNLLDCPGLPDFAAGAEEGMAACETALIAVSAVAGVEVMTRKLWNMATVLEKPKVFVITKMDHERARFDEVLEQLREVFGKPVAPLFLPVGVGKEFKSVVNLLDDIHDCPPELEARAKELHASLVETAVSADDRVMERYLADEKISHEEIAHCFTLGILSGAVVPVMCVSAEKDIGVKELLQVLVEEAPSPLEEPVHLHRTNSTSSSGYDERILKPSPTGLFYAQVFKSKRDTFVGKLSYLRVFSGSLASGGMAKSSSAPKAERCTHFLEIQGKETKEKDGLVCGDIVAIAKNEHLNFNDTLCSDDTGWHLPPIPLPRPMYALAIEAKNRNDEAKLGQRLRQLAESDPTFIVEVDPQTHELVIRGMGLMHLELMLHRLKVQHLEVNAKPPKIAYRSTVAGLAEASYTHKKQSGGAGQFGKCQLKVEPNLGSGFEFVDEIVGGVIPRQYIPACEKGVLSKMAEGVWPGIPVVDVLVRLIDGKHHDVDSKDIAFQIAAREAFKEAFENAKPQLTEPIMNLEVFAPSKFMGDVTGNLSSHRARIQDVDQEGDLQVVRAQLPMVEVQNYSSELKALTGGEGYYNLEFSHYDLVPGNLAQPIIEAAKERGVSVEK